MLHGGMPRHQVQQHMHSPLVRLGKQALQILVRAVPGRDAVIIRHIVPRVAEGRQEAGIDPQRVAAQPPDIVQLVDDPLKIADTVSIGIKERLGVNFVKYSVIQPFWHKKGPFLCICGNHTTTQGQCQG